MIKKKFLSTAKNVINLEINALQQLKKKLITLLTKQLFKFLNVSQKLFYVV